MRLSILKLCSTVLIILSNLALNGQGITISGYLRDAESGENLIGGTVQNLITGQGTTANVYGFYSVTQSGDSAILHYSYVGYQPQIVRVTLSKDTTISVLLKNTTLLSEVVVRSDRAEKIHETSRLGTTTVPVGQLQKMPVFMGESRLSARWLMGTATSLKASYSVMQQFVHLLTNSGVGLLSDLWVPATAKVKPQGSQQWAVGIARTWHDQYEISVEAYYKKMDNLLEYKDGASYLSANQNWQDKVEAGKGESYGAEWFVHKKSGKMNGWIGYTLSWANRRFENLNDGQWFPYRYDRRHDAKVAVGYALDKKIDIGLVWVYGTGNAITVPMESYRRPFYEEGGGLLTLLGSNAEYYESRNNFRMRDYHRLDLNVSYKILSRRVEHALVFSVYNTYGRRNPFYVEFGYEKIDKVLRQVSLFSVMPSISYSLKF